jgi:hypothetical protein
MIPLSQADMEVKYKSIAAPDVLYKKQRFTVQYRIAISREIVITRIEGKTETQNTTTPGDFIITGQKQENYILTPAKFHTNYEVVDSHTARTKAVYINAKIFHGFPFMFTADWGELMIVNDGDYVVKKPLNAGFEYYRIEKSAFAQIYTEGK